MAIRDAITRALGQRGGGTAGAYARGMNVGDQERLLSTLAGVLIGLYGLARIRLSGILLAAAGGALVYRGVTGRSRLYWRFGVGRATTLTGETRGNRGIKTERDVVVNAAADTLYRIWRNLENLPRFMSHIERVQVLDDRRSRWTISTPARVGAPIEWEAEIINDRPGELIAWQTVGRAPVDHAGSVRFEPLSDGHSTRVRVELQYDPPAGELGHVVASLFGQDAGSQIDRDLRELKRAVEAGEITPGAATRRREAV